MKRQDELNQVVVAQIEMDMSGFINKEFEPETISNFKLTDGEQYANVELEVEWTIVKSENARIPHNHEHKIDLDD